MGILIGLTVLLFIGFVLFKNGATTTFSDTVTQNGIVATLPSTLLIPNSTTFSAPYKDYTLTQGPHGFSYGHIAIDLAAGRGTPVLSPINGVIVDEYTDQWGNSTLVIENDTYRVLLLHGDYTGNIGDTVTIGDPVGTEGNNGYTTDMAGNLCYGRTNCGNHTHLNVFDKTIGANVNPLELIRP
jgi:murein DD-endopeptidase MepM/ murein hydrolase activator NlpD